MEAQYWWLIAGVALLIIEIFNPSFFAASLGLGCFSAAIVAFLGGSLEIQLLLLSLLSIISIFIFRPLIKKYLYSSENVSTNADALIGKQGVIVEPITNNSSYGRLAIDGDEWQFTLVSADVHVAKGDRVRVVSRDSIILTVEPL